MTRLSRLLRWGNVLLILLTFFAYLSPSVPPTAFWPFAVAGLFYPWLLLGHLAFLTFWLVRRRYYFIFSLGCILLGWGHFTAFVGWKFPSATKDGLRVMTFNAHGFRDTQMPPKAWQNKDLMALYQAYQPDVWCFQEYAYLPKKAANYAELLQKKTPLRFVYREAQKGLAIFSRFPIRNQGGKYFTNNTNGYLWVDLETNKGIIRVFNIHLQTNAVSRMADQVASEGNLQEKETWLQIRGMISRYRRSAARRAGQAREIAEKIAASPHPVIICGDFNDVPTSYTYRLLARAQKDAFRERGRGLGTTFAGSIPALRIDYILHSPSLKALDHRIVRQSLSDHYPVFARLDW